MKKSLVFVLIFTFIARIIGYAKEFVLAYYYGTNYVVDAYIVATTIPIVVFELFSEAIRVGFIPKYVDLNENKGENKAIKFMNGLINLITLLTIISVIIIIIFAKPIVLIFASGFSGEVLEKAILFTRISTLGILFSGFSSIFKAFLNTKNDFNTPLISIIPLNIIIILSIIISSIFSPVIMPIGYV